MGIELPNKVQEQQKKKKVVRALELKREKEGKTGQVIIEDYDGPKQVIEECDFRKYAQGTSEMAGPGGEKVKVSLFRTTDHEETLKIAVITEEDEEIPSEMRDMDYKESMKGARSWYRMGMVFSLVIAAWSWAFQLVPTWDISTGMLDSPLFVGALAGTAGLMFGYGYDEHKNQNLSNFYELPLLTVAHSEAKDMLICVSTAGNYKNKLQMWFGDESEAVLNAVDNLGRNLQDKIDGLEEDIEETKLAVREEREKNMEQLADEIEAKSVTQDHFRKASSWALAKGLILGAAATFFIIFGYGYFAG